MRNKALLKKRDRERDSRRVDRMMIILIISLAVFTAVVRYLQHKKVLPIIYRHMRR